MIISLLLVGGGSFYTGTKYQPSKNPRFGNFQGARNGQFSQGAPGFRPVSGEIIGADDKSLTVKLQDGSSKIVLLTETTVINKSTEGSKFDIKAGEKVVVFGPQNSDGSLTAQNIQINPVFGSGSGRQTNN